MKNRDRKTNGTAGGSRGERASTNNADGFTSRRGRIDWSSHDAMDEDAEMREARRTRKQKNGTIGDRTSQQPRVKFGAVENALAADPRVSMWLADRLDSETGNMLMRTLSLPDLRRLAIMPDVHASRDVCVGSVIASGELVFPQAIGGDIGCGMSTIRLVPGAHGGGRFDAERMLAAMNAEIHVMARRPGEHANEAAAARIVTAPSSADLTAPSLRSIAERDGALKLGTLGGGNHFVEVQRDEEDGLWVMVHSGSRVMGQAVAMHYFTLARNEGVRAAMFGVRRDSAIARDYLHDQAWCVEYARANRARLAAAAARAAQATAGLVADWSSFLDAPHNFVAVETHDGEDLVVHRKGAAPAHAGRVGLIPGSAGTMSVHVEGRGEARSLCSSSHGAGRVFSRGDAKKLLTTADLEREMGSVVFDRARAHRLRDEAPAAYRDLRVVLEAQRDLVKVTRRLTPVVSFKAGG